VYIYNKFSVNNGRVYRLSDTSIYRRCIGVPEKKSKYQLDIFNSDLNIDVLDDTFMYRRCIGVPEKKTNINSIFLTAILTSMYQCLRSAEQHDN